MREIIKGERKKENMRDILKYKKKEGRGKRKREREREKYEEKEGDRERGRSKYNQSLKKKHEKVHLAFGVW